MNNGRLILEAGDKCGDELSSAAGEGDGSGLDDEDSPRPDVRAPLGGLGPSWIVSTVLGKGPEAPSSSDTS